VRARRGERGLELGRPPVGRLGLESLELGGREALSEHPVHHADGRADPDQVAELVLQLERLGHRHLLG
jgi:hypothetical protein